MINLQNYLTQYCDSSQQHIISQIAKTTIKISAILANGAFNKQWANHIGKAQAGDQTIGLDLHCDQIFCDNMKNTDVKFYASEESDEVSTINDNGKYALCVDPLDGSSNINVNITVGSIFSLKPALNDGFDSLLQTGDTQICAGYVAYGPQTTMMLSVGYGTAIFIYLPEKQDFILLDANCNIPDNGREYAINSANQHYWDKNIQDFINFCQHDKQDGKTYNTRWVASLVAEATRIIMRGGIFLYPNDSRKGYENGRLRLLYEAQPIAMLIEQAGGMASDCVQPIKELKATSLHQRTPLIFGSPQQMAIFKQYTA